ncbi:MAG: POTRA domain-containing protein, partial [Candidatus Marinimicrobia bacterium]|nr:POTRA domain-containing protein [Candidatus Neomarinimicrobiota bacterium]
MKRTVPILLLILCFNLLYGQNDDVLTGFQLRKIFFKGNQSFSKNQLKRVVDIKPVYTQRAMQRISYRYLKSQTKNIKNYYVSEGFLNCTVQDSIVVYNEKHLHLYFNIRENERFTIRKVSVEGNTV